jgi:ADP-ribose pyrophosphatase YjhB (NUDIX family)
MEGIPRCFYRVSIKALVLNETKDKFLLCRESDGRWELPGGGLEWGTTPQEDLPRELMEEMGLKATWIADNPCYLLTAQSTHEPIIQIVNVLYETKLEHFDFTPSDECMEIRFVNDEDILYLQTFEGPQKLDKMFDSKNHQAKI